GRAPLCGNREFVRPAASCVSSSTLYVAGSVLTATPPVDATSITGTFKVHGLAFGFGTLNLQIVPNLTVSADTAPTNITMTYTDDHGARVPSKLERIR